MGLCEQTLDLAMEMVGFDGLVGETKRVLLQEAPDTAFMRLRNEARATGRIRVRMV